MRPLGLLSLTAPLLASLLQGCPSCPYDSACDGNTLLTCSLGVDQVVGSPDEQAIPCEDPNPVCLTLSDTRAQCGIAADRTCERGAEPRCDGDVLVECAAGFERATDCAREGNVCGSTDGGVRCYAPPLTACEPSDLPACDGDVRRFCLNGYFQRLDCALRNPEETCIEQTFEAGTTAFCGTPME